MTRECIQRTNFMTEIEIGELLDGTFYTTYEKMGGGMVPNKLFLFLL